ncbi:MAG: SDR family oxidoreductase [Gammaproteobacteria bacterium]|nr:SDR family oxidoreductase [Gammaproteobacteria bacterium]
MILVTGATGFIGRALCGDLSGKNRMVRAAARGGSQAYPVMEVVTVGEIGSTTEWGSALIGVDTVIHLAALAHTPPKLQRDDRDGYREVNALGAARIARQAAEIGVRRFVYLSTAKVCGDSTQNRPFDETDMSDSKDPYTASKREAEKLLRDIAAETGLEMVILRPPLVYGLGVKANFLRLMEWVWRGVPLPLEKVNNRRSLIYVGNLVDAIIACIEHPAAAGKTFLVSDNEDVSTPELVRRMARALGRPARLFRFPPALLRAGARLTGKQEEADRLLGSLVVDSSKIRRELGWMPPYTMEQGLAEAVRWFKSTHGA